MKKITVKLQGHDKHQFKFSGIASTERRDSYGEIIKQKGIDLSLVPLQKVIVNSEHEGPTIGRVTYAEVRCGQLYLEGLVEVKTIQAKKFYELLKKDDSKYPVTLSIEAINPEYSKKDKTQIDSLVLTGVALVGLKEKPANKDTYAELLKSVSKKELLDELLRRANTSIQFKDRLRNLIK